MVASGKRAALARRVSSILVLLGLLLFSSAGAAEKRDFSPDSEAAGWLWPAAFSLYGARAFVVDMPLAYLVDTPRLLAQDLAKEPSSSEEALVRALADPDLLLKEPLAAELRRRTGKDFGYRDEASWMERQRAVGKWRSWLKQSRGP
jgi:hypothetical protein